MLQKHRAVYLMTARLLSVA